MDPSYLFHSTKRSVTVVDNISYVFPHNVGSHRMGERWHNWVCLEGPVGDTINMDDILAGTWSVFRVESHCKIV